MHSASALFQNVPAENPMPTLDIPKVARSINIFTGPQFIRAKMDIHSPIPWISPNGAWDVDGFARISQDGTSITFRLGNDEQKGCNPAEIISFAYHYYRFLSTKKPSRELSLIITKLEEALLHEINRNVKNSFEPH